MITYSNPRLEAVIPNWPIGNKRTVATFRVETVPGRGQRGTRFTIDPKTGRPSAVNKLTYASEVRIVDGDDGKTYIVERTRGTGTSRSCRATRSCRPRWCMKAPHAIPNWPRFSIRSAPSLRVCPPLAVAMHEA